MSTRPPLRPSPRFLLLLVLVLAAPMLVALRDDASTTTAVRDRIEDVLASDEAQSGFWGIYIQDLRTGDVLFEHNAQKPMIPASNQKLLTTAAALDALGSTYRFETTLYFDGTIDGSVLKGDLILRGSGDPTFGTTELRVGPDPLREWAEQLAAMGVTRIEGRLIGDDDAFDDRAYAEGWDIDYLTSQSSRAMGVSAGGLAYRDNVVPVQIRSTSVGQRADVRSLPDGYLDVNNQTSTSSRRRGFTTTMDRHLGAEAITIRGSVPRAYRGRIEIPVSDPTAFTLYSFEHHLREAGIETAARRVDVDELDTRLRYDGIMPLFVHVSPPLTEIAALVNKESNNFYAEQLFRSLTSRGSADASERRIKSLLSRTRANTDAVSIRDGSGLSRKDFITAEAMGRLLAYMYQHDEREAFMASLARGGEAKTTLQYRLRDVPVRAKTGSLQYVRTLSGYATTPDGRPVAFALFANNYTAPAYRIMRTIDQIVLAVTRPVG